MTLEARGEPPPRTRARAAVHAARVGARATAPPAAMPTPFRAVAYVGQPPGCSSRSLSLSILAPGGADAGDRPPTGDPFLSRVGPLPCPRREHAEAGAQSVPEWRKR